MAAETCAHWARCCRLACGPLPLEAVGRTRPRACPRPHPALSRQTPTSRARARSWRRPTRASCACCPTPGCLCGTCTWCSPSCTSSRGRSGALARARGGLLATLAAPSARAGPLAGGACIVCSLPWPCWCSQAAPSTPQNTRSRPLTTPPQTTYGGVGGPGPKSRAVREFDDVVVSLMGLTGWWVGLAHPAQLQTCSCSGRRQRPAHSLTGPLGNALCP